MDISKLDNQQTITCLKTLVYVLNQRKHTLLVMGKEVIVGGSLSKALKLPDLVKKIESSNATRQQAAVQKFHEIWDSLSDSTKQQTIEASGLYEPKELAWDDPRSNRRAPSTFNNDKTKH